jgi:hypothetical protein
VLPNVGVFGVCFLCFLVCTAAGATAVAVLLHRAFGGSKFQDENFEMKPKESVCDAFSSAGT